MKICVVGAAGGIGQPLALLLKSMLPPRSELALYDLAFSTPGVAVDLSHIPTDVIVSGHCGTDASEAMTDADVVVIPAGVARQPGMSRDDLFITNGRIIKSIIETGARVCPNTCYLIITNPIDAIVPLAAKVLREQGVYQKNRLMGVTTLDVIRSDTMLAEAVGAHPDDFDVSVIGGHNVVTILPLLSQVKGHNLNEQQMAELTYRIQHAGTEVVEAKAGGGSATLSMAYAAARFTVAVVKGLLGEPIVECAFVQRSEDEADFFAQPVRLGVNGVEEVLDYGVLSEAEQQRLSELEPVLADNIAKGLNFSV